MRPMMLLDLDGVFSDMMKSLAKVHGLDLSNYVSHPGEYTLTKVFPQLTNKKLWDHPSVRCAEFWSEMPKTPWADELMELVLSKFPKDSISFLTKPVMDSQSLAGKADWIKKHYPKFKFLIGNAKEFCAGPGKYLIDDADVNIDEFNKNGGTGILFPAHWNALHAKANDPVKVVRERLNDH